MAAIFPWLAGVAVAVAGFALLRGLLHRGIRASLAAPRIAHEGTPAAHGLGFEAVRIDTANRRRLHGWLIPPAAPDGTPHPAVIVIHGWGGNAAMMLPLARPLHDAGFAALFIDARCHGASDDDSFASLPRFAEDLEHALAWQLAVVEDDPGVGHGHSWAGRAAGRALRFNGSTYDRTKRTCNQGRWGLDRDAGGMYR